MRIAKLIEILTQYPGNMKVILSRDEEGNGFSLLAATSVQLYHKVTGDVVNLDEPEYISPKAKKVLCLWP